MTGLIASSQLTAVKSIKCLDAPKDISDGIIETGSMFKRLYTNVNVLICGILPCDR